MPNYFNSINKGEYKNFAPFLFRNKFLLKFLIYLLLAIINGVIFSEISKYFNISIENDFDKMSIFKKYLVVGIISPIIETFIFQAFIFKILNKVKYFENRKYLIILVSSILFALSHSYSSLYIFMTFIAGLIINTFYMQLVLSNSIKFANIVIIVFHMIFNLLALSINY